MSKADRRQRRGLRRPSRLRFAPRVAARQLPDEQRLDVVPDERPAGGEDRGRRTRPRASPSAATRRPSGPATARPSSVAAPRMRVVEGDADRRARGCARQPRALRGAARIDRAGSTAGGLVRPRPRRRATGSALPDGACTSRPPSPPSLGHARPPVRLPPAQPTWPKSSVSCRPLPSPASRLRSARSAARTGPARCAAGHGTVRSASRSSSPGAGASSPVDAGQPLDERSELVLAEEADDLGAVVVAEPAGRQVELDRARSGRW